MFWIKIYSTWLFDLYDDFSNPKELKRMLNSNENRYVDQNSSKKDLKDRVKLDMNKLRAYQSTQFPNNFNLNK